MNKQQKSRNNINNQRYIEVKFEMPLPILVVEIMDIINCMKY